MNATTLLGLAVLVVGCDDNDKHTSPAPASVAEPVVYDAAARTLQANAPPDASAPAPRPTDAAPAGPTSAQAFAELLDTNKTFVFELVKGKSIDRLRRIPKSATIIGKMDPPTTKRGYTYTWLINRPDKTGVRTELAHTALRDIAIGFEGHRIRHLLTVSSPSASDYNTGCFTFPVTLTEPLTIEGPTDFGSNTITVTREQATVAGADRELLVSRTVTRERGHQATSHQLCAYAPGLGPALLCSPSGSTRNLECLRLVEVR